MTNKKNSGKLRPAKAEHSLANPQKRLDIRDYDRAYSKAMNTPIDFVLAPVLSDKVIEAMKALGFRYVKDIRKHPLAAQNKVPSYGPIKNSRAQKRIAEFIEEVRGRHKKDHSPGKKKKKRKK